MKSIIYLYLILFLSVPVWAQKWKPVKIDDSVQVSLPGDFTRTDTSGQLVITSAASFGNIIITRLNDNPATTPDIEKLKHLNRYYDDFVKQIQRTSKGKVTEEKDTVMGKLHIKDFVLSVDSGSGVNMRHVRILHEAGATYTFQFLFKEMHAEYAAEVQQQFFNSIKIPPESGLKTQFTEPENTTGTPPTGRSLLPWIIGLIVVIVLFIIIAKIRKNKGNKYDNRG